MRLAAIVVSLIFLGCSSEEQTDGKSHEIPLTPEIIYSECGPFLFAALYQHPQTTHLLPDRDLWIAQLPEAFEELLDSNQQKQIKRAFRSHLDQTEQPQQLMHQLKLWCIAYESYLRTSEEVSREEFLADLYTTEETSHLFDSYRDRPFFRQQDISSFEKMGSLSSAESNQIILNWISEQAYGKEHNHSASGTPVR
jgi:hypothetical protein